jgi:prophage tail gpP-like protein
MSHITLDVAGVRYAGWKEVSVQRGLEQLAGAFSLTCADRWALRGLPLPELKGQRCTVSIENTPVIDGWIDAAPPRYNARSHDLLVNGRDATGDLVDSCARVDGAGWLNRSLRQIAVDLLAPFGIRLVVDASVAKVVDRPFQYQRLQIGETVFEALSRLARIRGVLLMSDARGGLVICRAGRQRASTQLVLGVNLLEAYTESSDAERFAEYRVVGQARETDDYEGESAQQIGRTVRDPMIRRGRLLIIDPVDATDIGGCEQLAAWTKALRAAQAQRVTYVVRGWMDGARPWQPNTLVQVEDPFARFDGEYLIASVEYSLDSRGELATLGVLPPDAYTLPEIGERQPEDDQ